LGASLLGSSLFLNQKSEGYEKNREGSRNLYGFAALVLGYGVGSQIGGVWGGILSLEMDLSAK
jgi:hypothetical protein